MCCDFVMQLYYDREEVESQKKIKGILHKVMWILCILHCLWIEKYCMYGTITDK